MTQWIRILLTVQGTQVRSLVQEDSTCLRATKPMSHNFLASCSRACELQLLSLSAITPKACTPRACVQQQEKPLQYEAHTQ